MLHPSPPRRPDALVRLWMHTAVLRIVKIAGQNAALVLGITIDGRSLLCGSPWVRPRTPPLDRKRSRGAALPARYRAERATGIVRVIQSAGAVATGAG